VTLLPPPGPQRTRLVALALLGVVAVFFVWRAWGGSSTPTAGAPPVASNPQGAPQARAGTQGKPAAGGAMPVPVNLDKLEPVPDEPGVGRNLFRFGVPPAPPPPPPTAAVVQPPIVQGPPPPPPYPPPIELQLKGITKQAPDTPSVAWLKDPKAPADSRMLSGSEGQIVDGKYKLLKVGTESVIVSYVDGSGQKTILISRQ
jgi:hypothetical protein